jgi:DNA-binding transcriptional ArsR family regulator
MLMALADGRALPASVLAQEAGVMASTASEHLAKLTSAQLLQVERHGRHRYYRLAGPPVAEMIESIARVAPAAQVRSLRDGTRAHAVRRARTCYDHLAGRLGTDLMKALLDRAMLAGGDGLFYNDQTNGDRLAGFGNAFDYRLTPHGHTELEKLGIDFDRMSPRRPLIRYCVDWSEQRHHLAGALGAALTSRMLELGWIRRADKGRAVLVTDRGCLGLEQTFGLQVEQTKVR